MFYLRKSFNSTKPIQNAIAIETLSKINRKIIAPISLFCDLLFRTKTRYHVT